MTERYISRGPQDYGPAAPRVPFSKNTDWKSVMSTRWTIQRVVNFSDAMSPQEVAAIKGREDSPLLSAYDLRWTAMRAHGSTRRAWKYFAFGFIAGAAAILLDVFRATH